MLDIRNYTIKLPSSYNVKGLCKCTHYQAWNRFIQERNIKHIKDLIRICNLRGEEFMTVTNLDEKENFVADFGDIVFIPRYFQKLNYIC